MTIGKIVSVAAGIVKKGSAAAADTANLKSFFRAGINYENYDPLVSAAKNKVVGNLPKDLLNLLIRNNPRGKGDAIKRVQNAFEETALILGENEKLHAQALKRFTPNIDNAVKAATYMSKNSHNFYFDKIFSEKSTEVAIKAEEKLLSHLKKALPDVENVKITFLDQGTLANAYRCEIIGKNGQKVVNDRVIKVFKNNTDFTPQIVLKADEILSKYSAENIARYSSHKGVLLDKDKIAATQMSTGFAADIFGDIRWKNGLFKQHGAAAEANITENIRFMSGHRITPEDGLVLPEMTSMGNAPFSISRYVDDTMSAKRDFNFERLGLSHSDFQGSHNGINGICIDVGGVQPSISATTPAWLSTEGMDIFEKSEALQKAMSKSFIVGDKFSTKLLKRFQDCKTDEAKLQMIETFRQEAAQTKDMIARRKFLTTIEEIRNKGFLPQKGLEFKA